MHAEQHAVEHYVFLGDLIGYGADPAWVLATVMRYHENGAFVILGNHDEAVLLEKPDKAMRSDAQLAIEWTRSCISPEHADFIKSLPPSLEKYDSLFVHAHAWNPRSWDYVADVFDARRSLSATLCRFTFCGHLHEPALYHQGATGKVVPFSPVTGVEIPVGLHRRWLAVLGAVGQPRDGNPAACYVIYDSSRRVLTYHRVPFDAASTARKIREAGLPDWLGARLEMGA